MVSAARSFLPSKSSSSLLSPLLLPWQNQKLLNSYGYGFKFRIQGCSKCYKHNKPISSRNSTTPTATVYGEIEEEEAEEEEGDLVLEVREIKERCKKWQWRGIYDINYFIFPYPATAGVDDEDERLSNNNTETPPPPSSNTNPPLLLVHGFGASISHWRRNIITLAQSYTVYAIDLIGFGDSVKPVGFAYTTEEWAQLILDFLDELVQRPTVLIGNSIGSLACLIAAAGMNNKAIVDDWRIKLLLPLLLFIDFLLKQRRIASVIFDRAKERDNLRNILLSVYGNKESVDEDLVEIIREPTQDEGALEAFVSIVTGPPGPNPVQLMPRITLPVLLLWGGQDPFTPLDGPVGKYFSSLPSKLPNVSLSVLQGVGHCPHDDRPDLVHEKLVPWLDNLPAS